MESHHKLYRHFVNNIGRKRDGKIFIVDALYICLKCIDHPIVLNIAGREHGAIDCTPGAGTATKTPHTLTAVVEHGVSDEKYVGFFPDRSTSASSLRRERHSEF